MGSGLLLSAAARRLEGKVALITGGASGIGKCTARLFRQHGAKVVIADSQDELGHLVCKDLDPTDTTFIHCDVTNEENVKKAVDTAVAKYGKLDIMFNNAGIVDRFNKNIVENEQADFKKVLDTNVTGVFFGMKHAARVMVPSRQGSIISMGAYKHCNLEVSAEPPHLPIKKKERETEAERESTYTLQSSLMATKVYIVYYSMYGHVLKLAEEITKGAASVEGVEAKLWQVPEILSDEILGKMHAPPKSDAPIIKPSNLPEADGFIFGFPTRFGMMAAQFKAFFDATGGLWGTQQLAGKPAGIFYSTGSQGGGQETTPLTAITQLVHHGMIFVPIGYTFGEGMYEMEKVKGGSPYGAGTYAGDGSRQPTDLELEQAFHQGKYIAGIAKKLKKGSA